MRLKTPPRSFSTSSLSIHVDLSRRGKPIDALHGFQADIRGGDRREGRALFERTIRPRAAGNGGTKSGAIGADIDIVRSNAAIGIPVGAIAGQVTQLGEVVGASQV